MILREPFLEKRQVPSSCLVDFFFEPASKLEVKALPDAKLREGRRSRPQPTLVLAPSAFQFARMRMTKPQQLEHGRSSCIRRHRGPDGMTPDDTLRAMLFVCILRHKWFQINARNQHVKHDRMCSINKRHEVE